MSECCDCKTIRCSQCGRRIKPLGKWGRYCSNKCTRIASFQGIRRGQDMLDPRPAPPQPPEKWGEPVVVKDVND